MELHLIAEALADHFSSVLTLFYYFEQLRLHLFWISDSDVEQGSAKYIRPD
jgi:hypothetical protein